MVLGKNGKILGVFQAVNEVFELFVLLYIESGITWRWLVLAPLNMF